ncbi:MAG: M24 family metallopeptidase [Nocardioidaceae bacterium]
MGHAFADFRGSLDASSTFADISDTGWYNDAEYERFSPAEYERRYEATRARMDILGLDALIVGGGPNHWTFGGGMLWLTGHWEWHGMACYLLVPRHDEPTLVYSMGGSHLEATRKEVAIADVRPSRGGRFGEVLADVIKEKGLSKSVIGHPPIDPRHCDYMPVNQLDALRQGAPEAEIQLVDEFFHDLLMVKSEEELDCVRTAGRLCVAAFDAMVDCARPGVAEWELRAAAASAILRGGGDVDFLIIGATSTHEPHMIFGNPRPSGRVLRFGDIVVDELAAAYRGYSAQIGIPIFVGEPEPSAARFYDEICVPGFQHMAQWLRPGNKLSQVHSAGRFFREHGYQSRPILLHGIDLVSSAPHIFVDECDDLEIVPGQVLMLEPTPISPDGNLGLFLGHTYIVGDDGVENVTEHSLERIVTG